LRLLPVFGENRRGKCLKQRELYGMVKAKAEVQRILDRLPEDASYEDIEYQLYLRRLMDEAESDSREGRVISREEVDRQMDQWLGS
jgi:hypothetical protein